MRLQYADAPSPPYPRAALRAGLQGPVMLLVLVDVDGRPLQVDVEHSSGHRVLDIAARRYVLQNLTFRAAQRGGRPVQAVRRVPIAYRLDRNRRWCGWAKPDPFGAGFVFGFITIGR